MSQLSRLAVLALVGVILSILLAISPSVIPAEEKEVERPPTSCSISTINPSFNFSSLQTSFPSKGDIELALSFSLTLPGAAELNNNVVYNVTLTPVNEHYPTVLTVVSHETVIKSQTTLPIRFAIPRTLANTHKVFELVVIVEAAGNRGLESALDRAYLSFETQTKESPFATLIHPAEYWSSRLTEIRSANSTLPNIHGTGTTLDYACEKKSWLSAEDGATLVEAAPRGGNGPPLPKINVQVNIQVRYQLDPTPTSPLIAFANAKVALFSTDSTMTLTPTWEFTLDSQGRAHGIIRTTADQLPVAATLYLDDSLFTVKVGTTVDNLQRWERSLDFLPPSSGPGVRIDEIIPQSVGPDLGHVWTEYHRIRAAGDAAVGIWDVPHLDLWYPSNGINSFYKDNLIQLLSSHSRIPALQAHEYGHHVMNSLMTGGIPSVISTPTHDFCPGFDISAGMAFVEGYATAFGLQALGLGSYGSIDIANYHCSSNRDMTVDEGRVAAGMLDLIDDDAASPECTSDADFGRTDRCDRTRGGQLFTGRVVLRESIIGPQIASITAWWNRLSLAHQRQPGLLDGREAMQYNYYPLPPACRITILGRVCIQFPFWS